MKKLLIFVSVIFTALIILVFYATIGTSGNVAELRQRVPDDMKNRGWEIIRYEGYEFGSFSKHGGYVWYHVRNINNHNIQYRVIVSLWDNELQYYYGSPEKLSRFSVAIPTK